MSLFIDIKVIPSSGKRMCKIDKNGMVKCYLKSVPEKGKANKELVLLLADILKIKKALIEIVSGHTSRKKRIKIEVDILEKEFKKKVDPNFDQDEKESQCQIFTGEE